MKKILIVILAVLSVALASVLGYQKLTQPETNQPIVAISDETADWKTYTNDQYGFEMKYPENWFSYESEGMEVISTFSKESYEKYNFSAPDGQKLGESYGLIWINFPNKPLEQFLLLVEKSIDIQKQSSSPYRIANNITEDLNIDGLKGYRIYYDGKSFFRFENGEKSVNIVYLLAGKENENIIRMEGGFRGSKSDEYARIFDQMLSTFKFIK